MPARKSKTAKVIRLKPEMDREQVARLAYELYLKRGCENGDAVEDWLSAERILIEKARKRPVGRRVADGRRRLEDKFQE